MHTHLKQEASDKTTWTFFFLIHLYIHFNYVFQFIFIFSFFLFVLDWSCFLLLSLLLNYYIKGFIVFKYKNLQQKIKKTNILVCYILLFCYLTALLIPSLILMAHWVLKNLVFRFYICVNLKILLFSFLLFGIVRIYFIISIIWNLLVFVLWSCLDHVLNAGQFFKFFVDILRLWSIHHLHWFGEISIRLLSTISYNVIYVWALSLGIFLI